MSASNEWSEWHLTPNGWIRGSQKIDFKGVTKKETPRNAVCTFKYYENQSSGFSKLDTRTECIDKCGTDEEIRVLQEKFGTCPESIY